MKILQALTVSALLFATTAHAEIRDLGVEKTADEFTGAESCSQIVLDTQNPYYLGTQMIKNEEGYTFVIYRSDLEADDIAHNMFMVQNDDALYLRFSEDNVEQYKLVYANAEIEDLAWNSQVAIFAETEFLTQLASVQSDVRYRIDSESNFDGTIAQGQLNGHQAFITQCLN